MSGRRLRLDTMAASGEPQAKRSGRPSKGPALRAPAPAGVPAPGDTSAQPLPASPSPLTAGSDALPLANGLWPPALLPQLAANWPPPGGCLAAMACLHGPVVGRPTAGGGSGEHGPTRLLRCRIRATARREQREDQLRRPTVPRIPRLRRRPKLPVAARILRLRRPRQLVVVAARIPRLRRRPPLSAWGAVWPAAG